MSKEIAIVGSGIAGLTCAYYAVKRGYKVTVYDKERYPAMQCSYANGAQISVSNSETWTTWSNIYKGIKWMLKKDAPLLIRPSLDFDKAIWLSKFLYHTATNDYAKNTAQTIRMGIEARKLYHEMIIQENLTFDANHCGILHIYKNPKYFDDAVLVKELYEANGCEWTLLNKNEILSIEPNLKNAENIIGGAFTKEDFVGDIHKFCMNLANLLEKYCGVDFLYNTEINHIDDLKFKDIVIIANGVYAKQLGNTVGDNIPIYPVKGYSITINSNTTNNFSKMPNVSILDDEAKIVSSLIGSRLRIAGTAEFDGYNYDIRKDRIEPLLRWVHKNFPDVNTNDYSSWACLRPMTPNMMPIYTRSRKKNNVYYHVGHGHLGWTLSPHTAKQLIETIINYGTT
jgi:D-amino-acid dehydrogenase